MRICKHMTEHELKSQIKIGHHHRTKLNMTKMFMHTPLKPRTEQFTLKSKLTGTFPGRFSTMFVFYAALKSKMETTTGKRSTNCTQIITGLVTNRQFITRQTVHKSSLDL